MTLRWLSKFLLAIIVLAGIGAFLVWAFLQGREELATEQARERPVKAASRVSVQDHEPVITLDQATRKTSGIVVAPLEPTSHQEELRAYGTVVELGDLIDLRKSSATAKADVDKAQANLEASRKEYERLKALHTDNRNISDKALQAAAAAWHADEANLRAAQEALRSAEVTARQRWGTVLARWLLDTSPAFDRLLQRQDLLLHLTIPPDVSLTTAPQTASVQAQDGALLPAKLVSPSPRTDPRIQGLSFFYLARAQTPGLLPGMNVLAYLAVGPQVQGVVIPASAVVWWQGRAWIYVQEDENRFVRRAISTQIPAQDGWFVAKGLAAGDRLVIRGAQLLLSEEFRAQIQVGG
jgi:multidrug efflux pump subunit AcrA (membrane-fusion protein)